MSQDGFTLSSAQSHEIEIAMNRSGNGKWTPELVHLLTKGNTLGDIHQVLLGHAFIKVVRQFIDCDANPFTPEDWTVKEHRKGGQFQWNKDAQKDALWLTEGQRNFKMAEKGNKLHKELKGKPVLNANVSDYLFAHPHLIPEEWKGKYVFFWGTIFRGRDGDLYVRCLFWGLGGKWNWSHRGLDLDYWPGDSPAALRAA